MKFSQFNTYIPYEGKIIAYNAYTNQYLLLEFLLYELIQSAQQYGIASLDAIHPSFYQALVDNGFVVEDNTNEIDKVSQLIDSVDKQEDRYILIVNPTMNCNFKCWYCYETHIKDSKMDATTLEKVSQHIKYVVENKPSLKEFIVSFFGGEPLLYYDKVVVPLLKYANQITQKHGLNFQADFTTNGFLIKPNMVDTFKELSVNHFQITLDGDKEHHDTIRFVSKKRGSYDDIVQNIILLANNGLPVTVRINYTAHNLDNLTSILEDLTLLTPEGKQNITISLHKVWQETDKSLGTKVNTFINLAKKAGFNTAQDILIDSVRNSCYADKNNHATINYNGEVFKCTARDFKSGNKEGELHSDGSITWNDKFYSRMQIKLQNKPCLECAILPICGGGCSQQAIEHIGVDYCVNDFDENKKKNIVLQRFLATHL
ncbi:MAG: radical SAM protein [Chitinophagales bacterium]|jgi:uncharacterized protein|nr:radical SAM protein [Chitinophagales bacterium]